MRFEGLTQGKAPRSLIGVKKQIFLEANFSDSEIVLEF